MKDQFLKILNLNDTKATYRIMTWSYKAFKVYLSLHSRGLSTGSFQLFFFRDDLIVLSYPHKYLQRKIENLS